jgi:RNA polymerase sigma-70 factor (ECF subfamily)
MTASTRQTRDELLALRCRTGDAGAFAELVREMELPLLYFVAKLVGESAALDVLQEVWLKAFRTIGRLAEPNRLRPWLYRLARGLAIDRVRKDRAAARREAECAREVEDGGAEPTFGADDAAAIHRALDALPLAFREVLVLHFLEELPLAEVAAVVGCPEGTVKSRLYHAKRALRAALGAAPEGA